MEDLYRSVHHDLRRVRIVALGVSIGLGLRGEAHVYTIVVVLLLMWLLGLVSGYTVGAFIHVLLVIAVSSAADIRLCDPANSCLYHVAMQNGI